MVGTWKPGAGSGGDIFCSFLFIYLFILAKLLRARRGMALSRLCPLFQQPHEVRKWIWERLQSVHMAAS